MIPNGNPDEFPDLEPVINFFKGMLLALLVVIILIAGFAPLLKWD